MSWQNAKNVWILHTQVRRQDMLLLSTRMSATLYQGQIVKMVLVVLSPSDSLLWYMLCAQEAGPGD